MLTATVSGSFHRHMAAIDTAVGDLRERGVQVLSPSDPRVVDHLGEFLFVASDRLRSVKLVQDRHLHSIAASSFLCLVTPDGYVGPSASMEIGFAVAAHIPVFSDTVPTDVTIREYVSPVANMQACIARIQTKADRRVDLPHLLVDPTSSIQRAHCLLDQLETKFVASQGSESHAAVHHLGKTRRFLTHTFGLSGNTRDA